MCLIKFLWRALLVAEFKAKEFEGQSGLNEMAAELLSSNNLVAEKEDAIVALEEEMDLLRKTHAKVATMNKVVKNFKSGVETVDEKKQEENHWQVEYDLVSLNHEDWLVRQLNENMRNAAGATAEISSMQSRINDQCGEISALHQRDKENENEMMKHEDNLVCHNIAMDELMTVNRSLRNDVADCRAQNVSNPFSVTHRLHIYILLLSGGIEQSDNQTRLPPRRFINRKRYSRPT